jgi:hypothetical protein
MGLNALWLGSKLADRNPSLPLVAADPSARRNRPEIHIILELPVLASFAAKTRRAARDEDLRR